MVSNLGAGPPLRIPRRRRGSILAAPAIGLLMVVLLVPTSGGPFHGGTSPSSARSMNALSLGTPAYVLPGHPHPAISVGSGPLGLTATTSSASVCAFGLATCNGTPGTLRVHLSAAAPSPSSEPSGSVQVLFLVEFSPLSTNCDWGAADGCIAGGTQATLQFQKNAGAIATALQHAHPTLNLTFGLVTTQGTLGRFDDGDGLAFNVPVGNFTSDSLYGAAVNRSYPGIGDIDSSDNALQTSIVTAMYGSLTGQSVNASPLTGPHSGAVNWSSNASHVVVWIGATAPQDPNYKQDVCPLADFEYLCGGTGGNGSMPTCEASYNFSGGPSPRCEGWVSSHTGNPLDSIASLSITTAACVNSTAGRCTVDSVMLNVTSTDPASKAWKPANRTNSTITDVRNDTSRVLGAGCDIAQATGGSWDGPRNSTCGNVSGTLRYVGNGSNPDLVSALQNVSLGTVPSSGIVASPVPSTPMFRFVPAAGFAPAPVLHATANCTSTAGPVPACPSVPSVAQVSGSPVLSWNWSSAAGHTSMSFGDAWSASFDLVPTGGPSNATPVDRCATKACLAAGAGSGSGPLSLVEFSPWGMAQTLNESFPLATVTVVAPPPLAATVSASSLLVDAPSTVGFAVSTSGGHPPFLLQWKFGDGSSLNSTTLTVNHTFVRDGFFGVRVQITDTGGTVLTPPARWVTVLPALQAAISPVSDQGTVPLVVQFGAQVQGGLAPYTVRWDFGNGSSAQGTATNYTFENAGNFTVMVSVTDSLGRIVNSSVPIVADSVSSPPPLLATATVAATGQATCATPQVPYAFDGTASGGVAPYTFRWNFGDGSTANGPSATHSYSGPITSTPTLNVTDSTGATVQTDAVLPHVPSPPAPCAVSTQAGGGLPLVPLIVLGLVAVGAVAAVALIVRRRRAT